MTPDELFEAELRALTPRSLSPHVRRGIARRLAPTAWRSRAALAGGLVAAGLLIALVRPGIGPVVPPKAVEPVPRVVAADQPPTVQAYQRALAQSPAALEALLDAQSLRSAAAGAPSRPVHAFAVPGGEFLTWRETRQ